MAGDEFFDAPEAQNVVKSIIVAKYFDSWSTIMLTRSNVSGGRIAYVDLFSGPGKFEDGSLSTPFKVLLQAINDPRLCARLVTVFNDMNPAYTHQLQESITAFPGIEKLTHKPVVANITVGTDLVQSMGRLNLVPTLFFIDPWGYKGLSLDLIGNAIRSWGCDCIFFFNYNRINPGISNPFVIERMNDLFGPERADRLSAEVKGMSPDDRQTLIISELSEALKEVGGRYVLPFEFQSEHGTRTSHYIIFVSKHFLGYHLMKEAMFSVSSDEGEVRQFRYVPVKSTQMSLFPDFGTSHSIPLLQEVLLTACAGRSATVWDIYEAVTVDTPYTRKNVKDALIGLETQGKVSVDSPVNKRMRKGVVTLGDKRVVTFPS